MAAVKDILTIAMAGVGAALGIINTLHQLSLNRVKLRIVPKSAKPVAGGAAIHHSSGKHDSDATLCIEVINLSAFPVTIREVGYSVAGTKARKAVPLPALTDNKAWPRRLEQRESVTAYVDFHDSADQIKKAYAITECGNVRYGTSPALEDFKRKARSEQKEE
jgi:hypothetical protein